MPCARLKKISRMRLIDMGANARCFYKAGIPHGFTEQTAQWLDCQGWLRIRGLLGAYEVNGYRIELEGTPSFRRCGRKIRSKRRMIQNGRVCWVDAPGLLFGKRAIWWRGGM